MAPENLHLTLRYLGPTDPGRLLEVRRQLRRLDIPAFDAGLGGVGWFGARTALRSLHLRLALGRDEIAALSESVDEACLAAGVEVPPGEFRPHLTLARAQGRAVAALPALTRPPDLPSWRVDGYALFESQLGPPLRYVALDSFSLQAG